MTALAHANTVTSAPEFDRDWSFAVVLRRTREGPVVGREALVESDLADARAELWFNAFLRRGRPDLPLEDLEVRAAPWQEEETAPRLTGLALRATSASTGTSAMQRFPAAALTHAAERAATHLVDRGVLREGEEYVYELDAVPTTMHGAHGRAAAPGDLNISVRTAPVRTRAVPLAPLLESARPAGPVGQHAFAVIFTAEAHEKAERYARKGAAAVPPVETGCMLLGELCASPCGEMFLVVSRAVEVHAEEQEFALVYNAATWDRVQRSLRRFQSGDASTTLRMCGQGHGHNFALEGEPCEMCASAPECSRTTVFVSTHDRRFMRAVFARQPWALCWIAGTNARHENVAKLFTWRGGRLLERGYHVVDSLPWAHGHMEGT